MTDNIHVFPIKKTPQEELLKLIEEIDPDEILVYLTKDNTPYLLSTFEDIPTANYVLDEIKVSLLLGDVEEA